VTRLDDLLGYDEDEGRPHRTSGGRLGVAVPTILAVGTVMWFGMRAVGLGVALPLVLAALLSLYGLRYVLRTINPPRLPVTLRTSPRRQAGSSVGDDGIRAAARRWDQRLEYASGDARHTAHLIRPAFAELVDERLRLRHGISRATDPARAYAMIGPQLGKFITESVPRQVSPQEIAILIAQMEAL
jgi:hypothetical protein